MILYLKNSLILSSITWAKDTNELIDHGTGALSKQDFEIKQPVNIYRFEDEIKIEKSEESGNKKLKLIEDEDCTKLGEIIIKDSKYYFKPIIKDTSNMHNESINSIDEINNLSWLVYKGQKIPVNKNKYIIKEGDIIKLGREILLIKDIHIKKKHKKIVKINNNETRKDNNPVIVSFHTQTSQSLNLNEDFNNFENNNNNLEEQNDNDKLNNETINNNDVKTSNNIDDIKNKDLISCNESDKNSEIIQKNKKICRICYMEEIDKKINPLIKPCKCSGSMKYIHYECLLHWLKTKVLINNNSYCDNGFFTIYSLNLIECELCKNHLPNYIKHRNRLYSLIDYDKFDKDKKIPKKESKNNCTYDNFIIFDEMTTNKEGSKFRYLVKFDENNMIKIGRGLEMQLILNDISVSRNHCQLKIDEDGNIILEDNNSKFGTLVLIQAENIEIIKGKTLTLQVGTNYLNMKLGLVKNLFGCCCVEEIDEKNSYEKINSNSVKYDKTNEILNESLTPENSDNEMNNNLQIDELIDKENKQNKMCEVTKKLIELEDEKINDNKNNKNSKLLYNVSTLKITDSKNKGIPNNIKIIKKRIDSINSKGSYMEGSTTKFKNEDRKIIFKKDNVIVSENENSEKDDENKKNKINNDINKINNNKNDNDKDESESDSDSDESSDDNNSSD